MARTRVLLFLRFGGAVIFLLFGLAVPARASFGFSSPTLYSFGSYVMMPAAGDFGRGVTDLALPLYSTNKVMIFRNDGSGVFMQSAQYDVGIGPNWVIARDLNGDGVLDLAVTNVGSNDPGKGTAETSSVTVLLGQGNATFGSITTYNLFASSTSYALEAADLDGVNGPDLVVADHGRLGDHTTDHFVSVLLNNGNGTFGAPVEYDAKYVNNQNGSTPTQVYIEDLNGDSKKDLVVLTFGSDDVSVMLGNGDGSFATGTHYAYASLRCVGQMFMTVADFNGDTKQDVVAACNGSSSGGGGFKFIKGDGDGTLGNGTHSTSIDTSLEVYYNDIFPAQAGTALANADLDGDASLDVIQGNNNGTVSIYLNYGSGVFTRRSTLSTGMPALSPQGIVVDDFSGDRQKDIIVSGMANGAVPTLAVFLNQGSNPRPVVTAISPATGEVGASLTLTVTGSNFFEDSVIEFNGSSLATTYVSSTQLTATVPGSNLPAPGTFLVTVSTPFPGGGISDAMYLTVSMAEANMPTLSSGGVMALVVLLLLGGSSTVRRRR